MDEDGQENCAASKMEINMSTKRDRNDERSFKFIEEEDDEDDYRDEDLISDEEVQQSLNSLWMSGFDNDGVVNRFLEQMELKIKAANRDVVSSESEERYHQLCMISLLVRTRCKNKNLLLPDSNILNQVFVEAVNEPQNPLLESHDETDLNDIIQIYSQLKESLYPAQRQAKRRRFARLQYRIDRRPYPLLAFSVGNMLLSIQRPNTNWETAENNTRYHLQKSFAMDEYNLDAGLGLLGLQLLGTGHNIDGLSPERIMLLLGSNETISVLVESSSLDKYRIVMYVVSTIIEFAIQQEDDDSYPTIITALQHFVSQTGVSINDAIKLLETGPVKPTSKSKRMSLDCENSERTNVLKPNYPLEIHMKLLLVSENSAEAINLAKRMERSGVLDEEAVSFSWHCVIDFMRKSGTLLLDGNFSENYKEKHAVLVKMVNGMSSTGLKTLCHFFREFVNEVSENRFLSAEEYQYLCFGAHRTLLELLAVKSPQEERAIKTFFNEFPELSPLGSMSEVQSRSWAKDFLQKREPIPNSLMQDGYIDLVSFRHREPLAIDSEGAVADNEHNIEPSNVTEIDSQAVEEKNMLPAVEFQGTETDVTAEVGQQSGVVEVPDDSIIEVIDSDEEEKVEVLSEHSHERSIEDDPMEVEQIDEVEILDDDDDDVKDDQDERNHINSDAETEIEQNVQESSDSEMHVDASQPVAVLENNHENAESEIPVEQVDVPSSEETKDTTNREIVELESSEDEAEDDEASEEEEDDDEDEDESLNELQEGQHEEHVPPEEEATEEDPYDDQDAEEKNEEAEEEHASIPYQETIEEAKQDSDDQDVFDDRTPIQADEAQQLEKGYEPEHTEGEISEAIPTEEEDNNTEEEFQRPVNKPPALLQRNQAVAVCHSDDMDAADERTTEDEHGTESSEIDENASFSRAPQRIAPASIDTQASSTLVAFAHSAQQPLSHDVDFATDLSRCTGTEQAVTEEGESKEKQLPELAEGANSNAAKPKVSDLCSHYGDVSDNLNTTDDEGIQPPPESSSSHKLSSPTASKFKMFFDKLVEKGQHPNDAVQTALHVMAKIHQTPPKNPTSVASIKKSPSQTAAPTANLTGAVPSSNQNVIIPKREDEKISHSSNSNNNESLAEDQKEANPKDDMNPASIEDRSPKENKSTEVGAGQNQGILNEEKVKDTSTESTNESLQEKVVLDLTTMAKRTSLARGISTIAVCGEDEFSATKSEEMSANDVGEAIVQDEREKIEIVGHPKDSDSNHEIQANEQKPSQENSPEKNIVSSQFKEADNLKTAKKDVAHSPPQNARTDLDAEPIEQMPIDQPNEAESVTVVVLEEEEPGQGAPSGIVIDQTQPEPGDENEKLGIVASKPAEGQGKTTSAPRRSNRLRRKETSDDDRSLSSTSTTGSAATSSPADRSRRRKTKTPQIPPPIPEEKDSDQTIPVGSEKTENNSATDSVMNEHSTELATGQKDPEHRITRATRRASRQQEISNTSDVNVKSQGLKDNQIDELDTIDENSSAKNEDKGGDEKTQSGSVRLRRSNRQKKRTNSATSEDETSVTSTRSKSGRNRKSKVTGTPDGEISRKKSTREVEEEPETESTTQVQQTQQLPGNTTTPARTTRSAARRKTSDTSDVGGSVSSSTSKRGRRESQSKRQNQTKINAAKETNSHDKPATPLRRSARLTGSDSESTDISDEGTNASGTKKRPTRAIRIPKTILEDRSTEEDNGRGSVTRSSRKSQKKSGGDSIIPPGTNSRTSRKRTRNSTTADTEEPQTDESSIGSRTRSRVSSGSQTTRRSKRKK